ncbi:MAG: hypothetical protein KY453_01730 [Gemmatimonadetes bacterium]|nr:hypothetical protein [Gemmatimonadota bacterium]
MAQPARDDHPWWTGGEERCAFCLGRYVHEMEIRCLHCDRPMCPLCVVTVSARRERLCPECEPSSPGGEG